MIEPFDRVEAVDLPRKVGEDERKGLLLVEAGDLDDQLHAAGRHGILTAIASSPVPSATSAAAVVTPPPAEAPAARRRLAALTTPVLERVGLGVLVLASLVGFLAYPTYPNYDSYYSLLWGRELARPRRAVLRGLPGADRASARDRRSARCCAAGRRRRPRHGRRSRCSRSSCSSPASTRSARRRSRRSSGSPRPALLVDALRLPVPRRARLHRHPLPRGRHLGGGDRGARAAPSTRWSCCCCSRRPGSCGPRRGCWPACTGCGSLPRATLARSAPATPRWRRSGRSSWAGVDFAVTGRPAVLADRRRATSPRSSGATRASRRCPAALYAFLIKLAKFPVVHRRRRRPGARDRARRRAAPRCRSRCSPPGSGTFALVGVAGLSVIDRYLLVPSLCVMVFAAVFIAGWTMLERGHVAGGGSGRSARRRSSSSASSSRRRALTSTSSTTSCSFRGDAHARAGAASCSAPPSPRALRCGPVYVPNHKLIPDVRWILDRPKSGVLARSSAQGRRARAAASCILVHTAHRALQAGARDRQRRPRRQPAAAPASTARRRASTTPPMSAVESPPARGTGPEQQRPRLRATS